MTKMYKSRAISALGILGVLLLGISAPASASQLPGDPGLEGMDQNESAVSASQPIGTDTDPVTYNRLWGYDRYLSAIEVSKAGFPGTAPIVYLASGTTFPDALASAPAAVKEGGSLLLTPSEQIPVSVQNEIKRLQPSEIVIVGGTNTISAAVETAANALTGKVTRVSGINRYETSRKIATRAFASPIPGAYLVTGVGFPDALGAGAVAGTKLAPVILVDPTTTGLDKPTKELLTALTPDQITIIGGENSVSAAAFVSAKAITTATTRINGADRYATSAALAATWGTTTNILISGGQTFPDALVGSALGGKTGYPILIAPLVCTTDFQYLYGAIGNLKTEHVTIVGGFRSISEAQATGSLCPYKV